MKTITNKMILTVFMAAAVCVSLSACMTMGRPFPVSAVAKIKIGETTRTEINQMFGQPWRTGIEDGKKTWTYADYRYSLFGTQNTRDLVLRFNEKGVVTSYSFNSSYPADH